MKTILLTGSAILMTAGVALAQTPNSAMPANRRVPAGMQAGAAGNVAMQTTTGKPAMPSAEGGHGMPTTVNAQTKMEPTMGSDTSGANVDNHTIPGQRPMAQAGSMSRHSEAGMARRTDGAMNGSEMGVPYNASAETYLGIANKAIAAHEKSKAHVALGRAETDLLTNSYVQGSVNGPISTPAISAIRDARNAVSEGNFGRASAMIGKAMNEMHGSAMGHGGMSNGNGTMNGQAGGSMKSQSSM